MFPWGPAFFGGTIPWHAVGILCIALGGGAGRGVLRVIRFPVVAASLIMAPLALAITLFAGVVHGQFYLFALTLAICGVRVAWCYRKMRRA